MDSLLSPDLFKDQVALVTGGTSGIGLAIARAFAAHGAAVGLVGRDTDKAARAVEAIRGEGGRARALCGDVRDYDVVERILQEFTDAEGPVDVLVNGAAGNFPAPVLGMSANGFKAVIDIDLQGTFNFCRAAFEHLRKPGARVLNISATQAFSPAPMQAHVCAAKAGIDQLTRVLALEWGPAGVRVNSIAPGPVDDTEGMKRLAASPRMRQAALDSVPLGRFASKEEMAQLALVLCSPLAAYVHGTVVVADGGQSLVGFGAFASMLKG